MNASTIYKVKVDLKDFTTLLGAYRVGKKLGKANIRREEALFRFDQGRLTVEAVGASHSIAAVGSWSGVVYIAFTHFDAIRRVPPIQDPLEIIFKDGKLKIGSSNFAAEYRV